MPETIADPRPKFQGPPTGVDRNAGVAGVIYGAILAEVGPFENELRGEFDDQSLIEIRDLMLQGKRDLKARWTHPGASNDGLGTYLGRWKNPRIDDGKLRADLHFSRTASKPSPNNPGQPFAEYLMDLAEEDPAAFECSLAPRDVDREYRKLENGDVDETKPPIWRVRKLAACDVVDKGDATHSGFLSEETFSLRNSNAVSARVTEALNVILRNHSRSEAADSLSAFANRYLDNRFGPEPEMPESQKTTETTQQGPSVTELSNSLAEVKEQLSAVTKMLADKQASDAADSRAKRIIALCAEHGCTDLAEGFVNDDNLSVGDVAERLLAETRKRNSLSTGTDPDTDDQPKPDAKRKKEFADNSRFLSSIGVTEEEYLALDDWTPTNN